VTDSDQSCSSANNNVDYRLCEKAKQRILAFFFHHFAKSCPVEWVGVPQSVQPARFGRPLAQTAGKGWLFQGFPRIGVLTSASDSLLYMAERVNDG